MRNLFILLVLICMACVPVNAKGNKILEKALKKECKEKLKEYKKEGWRPLGSSHTLEVLLMKHYDKLNELDDNAREVVGIATKCKSKNVGVQMATNNACFTYAQSAGSQLSARMIGELSADGSTADGEYEHFYAVYERNLEKEIRGELVESYSIIKDNGDGTHEVQVYFILDEEGARKARIRALEESAREDEESLIISANKEKILEFVK